MFYPRKVKGKNILCLESHWGGSTIEPRASVKPLLDYITTGRGTSYTYNFVYTREEFKYILENVNVKKHNLLFLAFHGKPGNIMLGKDGESLIDMDELSGILDGRFSGYGIHFSSCSVLNLDEEKVTDFVSDTGASFVSGYGQGVDYNEGALMDMAFLSKWFYYRNMTSMFKSIKKSYKDFIKENNFLWYLK